MEKLDTDFLVRVPGFEPGFRRWQRPVITTTLHSCEIVDSRLTFLSVGGLSRKPLKVLDDSIPRTSIDIDG